jgi:hypothetical protein
MKKKVCQLTPEQLTYMMENNIDLTFKAGSKAVNTDGWPKNLQNPCKKKPAVSSEDSDPFNADSEENIQINRI